MKPPRLLAITPPTGAVEAAVVDAWREAGALEVGMAVLLREPGASLDVLLDPQGRLGALAHACATAEIPVLLSCDASSLEQASERVSALGLAGVQLRGDPDAATVARARALLPDALVGRSCHGHPSRENAPVDYTCFAPVFAPRTITPGRHKQPAGLEALRRWTASSSWIVALGGIDPARAIACLEAGARGLAGISLFFGAHPRVAQDVAALVTALRTSPADDVLPPPSRRG